jgi:molybdopterin converting factor small subunit
MQNTSDPKIKISFFFVGALRKLNGWKNSRPAEFDEGISLNQAIEELDIKDLTKVLSFKTVNGKKFTSDDVTLNDGDNVKLFPRSFGG